MRSSALRRESVLLSAYFPQATCDLRGAKACLSLTRTLFRAFFPLSYHVVAFAGELRPSAKRL